MHRSRPVLPALAALTLLLAACGDATSPSESASAPPASAAASEPAPRSADAEPSVGAEPSEAAEDDFTVILGGFAFSTGELVVPAGTEVVFRNDDAAAHTVTEGADGRAAADPIINAQVGPDARARYTFEEPGEYEITCLFHPSMNMTVVVEG